MPAFFSMISATLRRILRQLHLWSALLFGLMLLLAGLTGSVLAWRHELDAVLNPALMRVQPPPTANGCDQHCQAAGIAWLSQQSGYGPPSMVSLPLHANQAMVAWYKLPSSESGLPRQRQVMLDPYRQTILGERIWGEAGWQKAQWMPGLFALHRYLLLGDSGKTIMAVSGLVLAFSSLLGLLLWLPRNSISAWRRAFSVHWRGSTHALLYSLHKSSGAIVTVVLIMLGITGCYFNQPGWFAGILPDKPVAAAKEKRAKEKEPVPVWNAAEIQHWLQQAQQAYPQGRITRLQLPASASGKAELRVLQAAEPRLHEGNTRISYSLKEQRISAIKDPQLASGAEAVVSWFYPLHSGEAFGLAGKALISVSGIALNFLILSGLYLWWKRRKPRR